MAAASNPVRGPIYQILPMQIGMHDKQPNRPIQVVIEFLKGKERDRRVEEGPSTAPKVRGEPIVSSKNKDAETFAITSNEVMNSSLLLAAGDFIQKKKGQDLRMRISNLSDKNSAYAQGLRDGLEMLTNGMVR